MMRLIISNYVLILCRLNLPTWNWFSIHLKQNLWFSQGPEIYISIILIFPHWMEVRLKKSLSINILVSGLTVHLRLNTISTTLSANFARNLDFFYTNSSNFPLSCRKNVIEAIFLSVLDYGDVIYRHAAASTLKPLDSVYHSALRFATGDPYNTHHCTLYTKVGWSSLAQRRDKHLYLFIYKVLTGRSPPYLTSLLSWASGGPYQTRSSNHLLLKVPRVHSELGKSAFVYHAPAMFNFLQQTLNLSSLISPGQFKSVISNCFITECKCFS